jgi:putative transposase
LAEFETRDTSLRDEISFYIVPSVIPIEQLQLPPTFVGFNLSGAFRNYERNLPHWRQPGATYFLTFRLNDSLPDAVVQEHKREQEEWRARIAQELQTKACISEPTAEEFEAFQLRWYRKMETVMDEGHGSCALKNPRARDLVVNALLHFHANRYEMHGFVVMPNHVYCVVRPLADWQPEQLLHSWKRFSARQINLLSGTKGQMWQHDTWNRIVRNEEHWFRAMRYTTGNPERAKLWRGESTVWVDSRLLGGDASILREAEPLEEPW